MGSKTNAIEVLKSDRSSKMITTEMAHKKHAAGTMVSHYKEHTSSIQAAIAELEARVVKESVQQRKYVPQ